MLIAALIGIPLGILLTRHQGWAKPVLGLANILQTIPSLALFGFLLPLPWLGETRGADRDRRPDCVCAAAHYCAIPMPGFGGLIRQSLMWRRQLA